MENSSDSSDNSESQTIVITPSQLKEMGLINELKNVTQNQSKSETVVLNKIDDNKPDANTLQRAMKNKLCTLLNHTPLVMQVKDVTWIDSDKRDNNTNTTSAKLIEVTDDDEEQPKPKFKIVSDEKLNISPSEIENMLSGGKMVKTVDGISSQPGKSTTDEIEIPKSSQQDSAKDPRIIKKEGLKRMQAKMYENLKKVLDEVDSLPLKDKASLNIKPLSNPSSSPPHNLSSSSPVFNSTPHPNTKLYSAAKTTDKTKDVKEKPCYMSTYRERKLSLDVSEKIKLPPAKNDEIIVIDGDSKSIESTSSENIQNVPKKRGRPRSINSSAIVTQSPKLLTSSTPTVEQKDSVDGTNKIPRKRGRPRKDVSSAIIASKSPERESEIKFEEKPDIIIIQSDTQNGAKSSEASTTPTPRKRGRPRKIRHPEDELNNSKLSTVSLNSKNDETIVIIQEDSNSNSASKMNVEHDSQSDVISEVKLKDVAQSDANATPEVKLHKKRGRKPKAVALALKEAEKLKTQMQKQKQEKRNLDQYTKSKSGRKRKVINYSLLNGDSEASAADDSDVDDYNIKVRTGANFYYKKPTKVSKIETESSEDEYGFSDSIQTIIKDDHDEEEEDEKEEIIIIQKIKNPKNDKLKIDEIVNIESDTGDVSDDTTEEIKGETIKSKQVKCCVCNDMMDEKLWSEHKRNVHNDLAWKNGEKPLVGQVECLQ